MKVFERMVEMEELDPQKCCYFFSAFLQERILANSGFNCNHEKQLEVVETEGKIVGCCYPWSCPLVKK